MPGSAELALQPGFVLVPPHLGDCGQVGGDRAGSVTLPQRSLGPGVAAGGGGERLLGSGAVTAQAVSSALPRVWQPGEGGPGRSRRNFPHKEVTAAEHSPHSGWFSFSHSRATETPSPPKALGYCNP